MADTKISALASGVPAVTTDLIPIARGTANYSLTAVSLLSPSGVNFAVNSSTGNVTAGPILTLSNGGCSSNATISLTGWNAGVSATAQIFSDYTGDIKIVPATGMTTQIMTPSSVAALTVGSSGTVTIAAPTSGTALVVNQSSTSAALQVQSPNATSNLLASFTNATTGGSLSIAMSAIASGYLTGTASGDSAIRTEANNLAIGSFNGNTLISNGSRLIATFAFAGNVTIAAPSSGATLTATAVANYPALNPISAGGAPHIALGTVASYNAWSTGYSAIQYLTYGSTYDWNGGGTGHVNNAYYNGTNWIYRTTNAAMRYSQNLGANFHQFDVAASGTSGNAITWLTSMYIGSSGNVTINAPTSGTALAITGTNSTTGIGAVIAGSYTGAGTTQLLSLNDLNNTNGVNLKLTGNGATTPSKTIRVSNGNMEILNDAYSATLLRVVDSGVIQIPAGGAMRIVATTYATIPAAATAGAGAQVWITDSGTAYTGANIGTIISAGGGANLAPLYSDGTNWRIG